MKMEPPTFNLHEKLRARERVSARPGANVHRARQVYESVFPNHTVDAVSGFEDVHVHKFTDCGRYLICFSRNQHDLVVFRFKGFGCASPVEGSGAGTAAASPGTPPSAKGDFTPNDADAIPEPGTSRDKYFDLAYTTPLTVDADLLARDFAVTVLDGDYLLLASSTPAEAPPRDTPDGGGGRGAAEQGNRNPGNANRESVANPDARRGGSDETPRGDRVGTSNTALITSEEAASSTARASGAAAVRRARDEARADTAARRGAGSPNATTTLPGSPTMDTVAIHLVRLLDGRVCDRRVYRDDYVRLRRAAAVSLHHESKDSCLVSVLSLRWQAFRMLRVVRRGKDCGDDSGNVGRDATAAADGDIHHTNDTNLDTPPNTSEHGSETAETAVFTDARSPVGSACAPDDDAPLAAQDRAEREWRLGTLADADDGAGPTGSGSEGTDTGSGSDTRAREVGGWSDPENCMFSGIKQKLMTRVLLEARRRDAVSLASAAALPSVVSAFQNPGHENTNHHHHRGKKRPRDPSSSYVPSVSAPLTLSETKLRETFQKDNKGIASTGGRNFNVRAPPPRPGSFSAPPPTRNGNTHRAFTSAFFSRYFAYAEWMVLWHVQLLADDRALLRFGTAEDVLAWGTRRSRAEFGAHPGSERCPETVMTCVMRWSTGEVVRLGDAFGYGGGLLGVAPEEEVPCGVGGSWHDGSNHRDGNITNERDVAFPETGVPGEPSAPQAEGSTWKRLASGTGGVGGPSWAQHPGGSVGAADVTNVGTIGGGVTMGTDPASPIAKASQQRHNRMLTRMGIGSGFVWPSRPTSEGHWNPSPYFDRRNFRYDQRSAGPDERPRPAQSEVSLKFTTHSRLVRAVERRVRRGDLASKDDGVVQGDNVGGDQRGTETQQDHDHETSLPKEQEQRDRGLGNSSPHTTIRAARFTFPPSLAAAQITHARVKRTVTHVFHPIYPFAISLSQAFMQPQVVSFHFRWGR